MSNAVDDVVATAGSEAPRVASELASFTRIVAGSTRLAKVLSDPNVEIDAKRSLISDLTNGTFHTVTIELVASKQSLSAAALVSSLVDLAAAFTFAVADRDGQLAAIEIHLYQFAKMVSNSAELRDALTNPAISDEAKEALIADLLQNKAEQPVLDLIRVLIALDHGRDVDAGAQELSHQAAARSNLVVAEVETAVVIDGAQQDRLTAAIAQAIGKPIVSRFSINPTILGSVVVRVGDEVFDGSVRHRLDQARLAIAGAGAIVGAN